ncbi:uroporphyrinogen-III C-methyltransferase [Microbacterium resistens]|uniref:uroporphyrinogen-III C-methyltransferase n=1 Tax=Microbacterium resistens TaxID=156977 RepID=A0ABY3RQ38_9MICO|nr:uroporphyrinogen-III C-methyltransferase [Microbacterium resistens]UGS25872.1 uroporphyrinogen-III C-methyltransferase [Microbacterium resistens]
MSAVARIAVPGGVVLVGAGPGDAGLLTRAGLRALQEADVIVADRLGARAVLDQLAAEGVEITAEVLDVGKLPGHHRVPQAEINALLVRLAGEGRAVVRLKGGDPFVLGRGREEQLHLEEEGVPVRVVPGVTSAVSVPAVAGIPLTHRGVAASFTVASGHDPIAALPGGRDHTIVLLMGIGTLAHAAAVLARGVRGGTCPIAIVEDGYGPGERVTIGTLDSIVELAAARRVRSPAVVVIGDVVRLSPEAPPALRAPRASAGASPEPSTPPPPPAARTRRAGAVARLAEALEAGLAVDTGLLAAVRRDEPPFPFHPLPEETGDSASAAVPGPSSAERKTPRR